MIISKKRFEEAINKAVAAEKERAHKDFLIRSANDSLWNAIDKLDKRICDLEEKINKEENK